MILEKGHSSEYLEDYRTGKIPMGLGIGCSMDDHIRWKRQQFNFILGHDNVGKTYMAEWYFLALASVNNLTFCLFMDENYQGKVMRDLIQMYTGKPFKDLTYSEMKRAEDIVEGWFKFYDNKKRYTPTQLVDGFLETGCDNLLIDPYNALDTPFNYTENYKVLNELKLITKKEDKTIYINAHPASASGRRSAVYPDKHDWAGHVMPPLKSDIEGGKPFSNKADDFLIAHRLTQHQDLWKYTMVEVVKVKDTDTGGKPTVLNSPLMLDYNYGLGFKIAGVDPINRELLNGVPTMDNFSLENNTNFDNEMLF